MIKCMKKYELAYKLYNAGYRPCEIAIVLYGRSNKQTVTNVLRLVHYARKKSMGRKKNIVKDMGNEKIYNLIPSRN